MPATTEDQSIAFSLHRLRAKARDAALEAGGSAEAADAASAVWEQVTGDLIEALGYHWGGQDEAGWALGARMRSAFQSGHLAYTPASKVQTVVIYNHVLP